MDATQSPPAIDTTDDAALDDDIAIYERLLPAIERYRATERAGAYPVYRAGLVASDSVALPAEGVGVDGTLDELGAAVEAGCRVAAPGFFGFITTGATTSPAAAHTAVAAAGGQRYGLHAFNALERTGLRWLAELCGLPAETPGVFSSGGSTANLVALGTARQAAFERLGVDASQDGMPTGVQGRIYASVRAHRTVHRAAAVLGLGRNAVVPIPTDTDDRIDRAALEAALRSDADRGVIPIATVAVAGSTDTGAVDPIAEVIDIARRYGSWVHVDGAYGLVANASPEFAPLFDGVRDADSWIVDPHKWLATGLGVGATFVRDEGLLTRAFAEGEAAYLEGSFDEESAPEAQYDQIAGLWADQAVELSAPPRGVLVWSVLREIGRAGVARRVERHVAFARRVADRARSDSHLELLLEPTLSITCFRYRPARDQVDIDDFNERLLTRIRRETPFMPTSTIVRGQFALRPCFINPRTVLDDVDGMLEAVLRIGAEMDA